MTGNIEDRAEAAAEPARVPAPAAWVPQAESWAAKAIPMPAWARQYARTGVLPTDAERLTNEHGLLDSELYDLEQTRKYERHWRDVVRLISDLKSTAARQFLATPKDSPLRPLIAAQLCAIDDERDRLHALHRKGAPIVLRAFPPVTVDNAGRSVAAVEREASKAPLFAQGADDGLGMAFL